MDKSYTAKRISNLWNHIYSDLCGLHKIEVCTNLFWHLAMVKNRCVLGYNLSHLHMGASHLKFHSKLILLKAFRMPKTMPLLDSCFKVLNGRVHHGH